MWLAPGDQHLRLEADRTLSLGPPEGREPHVPSGDVLLRSLAEIEGEAGVAVVLSGMGEDGARGALAVAQAGGLVLAQDVLASASGYVTYTFGPWAEPVEVAGVGKVAPGIEYRVDALNAFLLVMISAIAC